MNAGLRWRVITLQIVLVFTLAFTSGFLYWPCSSKCSSPRHVPLRYRAYALVLRKTQYRQRHR